MKREFKNITIAITNLGTGRFEYYDVKDKADYINSISAFNEEFNKYDNDIEIQLIDYDYKGKLNDMNLESFLDLCEDFPSVNPQEIVFLLQHNYSNEVEEILRKGILYVIIEENSKVEAFREFIETYDIEIIPEHLKSWIDWEQVLYDYECNGTNVNRVDYRTYLIVY